MGKISRHVSYKQGASEPSCKVPSPRAPSLPVPKPAPGLSSAAFKAHCRSSSSSKVSSVPKPLCKQGCRHTRSQI